MTLVVVVVLGTLMNIPPPLQQDTNINNGMLMVHDSPRRTTATHWGECMGLKETQESQVSVSGGLNVNDFPCGLIYLNS